MKGHAALVGIFLFGLGGELQASALTDLSSPDQTIRDKAAAEIRSTYQEIPRSKWQPLVDLIHKGQTKASVLRLLQPLHVVPSEGPASGQSYTEWYRLDDTWILTCYYEDDSNVVIDKDLTEFMMGVGPFPPETFTGRWIGYFVNGQKASEIDYKNGRYCGELISYHPNGVKSCVQHYSEEGANGDDIGYYPSGHIMYRGQYMAGKQVGEWTRYDDAGKLTKTEAMSGVYEYAVTYSEDKDKPSNGEVLYKYQNLPLDFQHVIAPVGEFVSVKDKSFFGWQPVKGGSVYSNHAATEASTKSSLIGSFEHPPPGVGSEWFYVVGRNLWINPTKMIEALYTLDRPEHK
jgi:hypothetical protein